MVQSKLKSKAGNSGHCSPNFMFMQLSFNWFSSTLNKHDIQTNVLKSDSDIKPLEPR